jgi:hypothetical protein
MSLVFKYPTMAFAHRYCGGYVKASTGYSFTRTQRIIKNLVRDLERAKGNFDSFEKEKRHGGKVHIFPIGKPY